MLIGDVEFVAAFVVLLSLVKMYLVACCLYSNEYGPSAGGCFRIFVFFAI